MPSMIIKRDGREVPFISDKITDAILSAFCEDSVEKSREFCEGLTGQVVRTLEAEHSDQTPSVEEVQDIVERVLIANGFARTAKSYISISRRAFPHSRDEYAADAHLRRYYPQIRDRFGCKARKREHQRRHCDGRDVEIRLRGREAVQPDVHGKA